MVDVRILGSLKNIQKVDGDMYKGIKLRKVTTGIKPKHQAPDKA